MRCCSCRRFSEGWSRLNWILCFQGEENEESPPSFFAYSSTRNMNSSTQFSIHRWPEAQVVGQVVQPEQLQVEAYGTTSKVVFPTT